ncbi:MAG: ATP-dependent DNA helicase RecG, partial [Candidatus Levybacteria bacterium]|nr:ATP-dependent DNA helicase RecG [Candidatus Levybacteria bacterium]
NQPFIPKVIHVGDRVSLSGRVGEFSKAPMMESPEYEIINPNYPTIHTGRLVPVYPETKGLTSKWLRRQVYTTLRDLREQISETLPKELIDNQNLLSRKKTLEEIHFPTSYEMVEKARLRLSFEELFTLHLKNLHRKKQWDQFLKGHAFDINSYQPQIDTLINSLPFTLTAAQNQAISEMLSDLSLHKPMNRLLQGDVGSGKTVVAMIGMYAAFLNGFKSILMAPTEILAQQHYQTISQLLYPFGIKVDLITSSIKTTKIKDLKLKNRKDIPNTNIVVGTHAVLNEKLKLENVGLVVIDEQQRFGVEQRASIRGKGEHPHLLTMTATPIPRTVALTLYGNLDLSYLSQMPKGRQIIKTWVVPEKKRKSGYEWIKKEIRTHGSQVFIICPLIDESENMATVKAANKEYERLKKEVFADFGVGLLHGRMKATEKEKVLTAFKEKNYDILVATPVVEVGIDIPNATIILIEASERFGLAQLHQLRGRVGRSQKQSYCLLFTDSTNVQTAQRLKAMETLHNGAALAQLDFQLRGPGEIYGTIQHGTKQLRFASFSDTPLLTKTRDLAQKYYDQIENFPLLKEMLEKLDKTEIAPD